MSQDARSFESLYREHGLALLAYLTRRFGRTLSAEDLLQDTFVQALRAGPMTATVSKRAWLFGIARHVGLSAVRKHRPMQLVPDTLAAKSEQHDDLQAMREKIAELPEPLRETLELRLSHELSYEEIAAVMEIPIGTVRSRLHHAVRQLKEKLR
jgi:RNA polymerase sigma-70 factor, ECF subfamily